MNREELKKIGLTDVQIEHVMKSYGKAIGDQTDKGEYVEQLERRNEQLEDEKKEETSKLREVIDKQSFNFSLEKSLSKVGAKNNRAVRALLDTNSIQLDGDELKGLDKQLEALKKSDSYLFGEQVPTGLRGRAPHQPINVLPSHQNPFSKDRPNLTEQGKLIRENPEEAKQLMSQVGLNPANYGM